MAGPGGRGGGMSYDAPEVMKKRYVNEHGGQRLDVFLKNHFPDLSRNHVQELIRLGLVKVGGETAQPSRRLESGAQVELDLRKPEKDESSFEDWILHEDSDLLVLNKPAGLLMHPVGVSWLTAPMALWTGEATLAAILLSRRPRLSRSGVPRGGIVHRLDRPTSGVLLVAKTREASRRLSEGFRERAISKVYRAIVRGRLQDKKLRVDAPVGRDAGQKKIIVTPFGRASQTGVTVVQRSALASLVEARPLTGRTHQIRAHLAYLGHPVAGDPELDFPAAQPRPERMMLHAYRIELSHPKSGKPVFFEAPPPVDFKAFWTSCLGAGSKR